MDLEKGERVKIDTLLQYRERDDINHEWAGICVGEFVEEKNGRVIIDFLPEESHIDATEPSPARGYTHEEYIIKSIGNCEYCGTEKLYSDKEAEWLCPFCELEEYDNE